MMKRIPGGVDNYSPTLWNSLLPSTTMWRKKLAPLLYALTLPNINQISKLFFYQNQKKICNNIITKDPTTPQVCRYSTL